MSRAAVTFHFGSKAAMLDAVVDDTVARWEVLLAEAQDEDLAATLDRVWERLLADPQLLRTSLGLLHAALGPAHHLLPRASLELRRIRQAVAQQLRDEGRPDADADAADAQAVGVILVGALTAAALEPLYASTERAGAAYAELRAAVAARLRPSASQR